MTLWSGNLCSDETKILLWDKMVFNSALAGVNEFSYLSSVVLNFSFHHRVVGADKVH